MIDRLYKLFYKPLQYALGMKTRFREFLEKIYATHEKYMNHMICTFSACMLYNLIFMS